MKRLLLIPLLFLTVFTARGQVDLQKEFFSLPDSVTTEYLDSMDVKVLPPNDYWMAGAYGGASMMMGYFNPDRLVTPTWFLPVYGFSIIRYYTMFGLFHNMGIEIGAQQNYEGYEFKENKETGYRSTESGAYKVQMKVPEAFILSHFHIDAGEHFKVMAKLGLYGGYRQSIVRTLDEAYQTPAYEEFQYQFRDYDRRWSYGVQGGLGFGVMFSPFEFHVNAQVKWGWSSFWKPDYASKYYYRFAYPLDGAVTFGIYYQFTPRYGHTRRQLRKLARKMVEEQNNEND